MRCTNGEVISSPSLNQSVEKEEVGDIDLDGLLKKYDEANESVGGIWIHEGQHAFFHHLNPIFGYEPVIIRNRISTSRLSLNYT